MGEAHKREAGPFDDVANVVEIYPRMLGWNPELGHVRTHLQVTGLGGGSAVLSVRGPAGEWSEHETGLAEDDIVVLVDPWPAFRFDFTSGGTVNAVGYSKVWR